MIDTRRWVLVEAWLSLGLRVEWAMSYEMQSVQRDEWMDDDASRNTRQYIYDGFGVWKMLRPSTRLGESLTDVPELSTATLQHELAHWLVSTEDERAKRNFGITKGDPSEHEQRAALAEQTITAMVRASGRIASLALGAQDR